MQRGTGGDGGRGHPGVLIHKDKRYVLLNKP
jgi:hypothetical protein